MTAGLTVLWRLKKTTTAGSTSNPLFLALVASVWLRAQGLVI